MLFLLLCVLICVISSSCCWSCWRRSKLKLLHNSNNNVLLLSFVSKSDCKKLVMKAFYEKSCALICLAIVFSLLLVNQLYTGRLNLRATNKDKATRKTLLFNNWTYYPSTRRKFQYGIVMGGTPNNFYQKGVPHTLADYSSCIALMYARRHGYAFVVNKDLGAVHNRTYGNCSSAEMSPWNKIHLMRSYLSDVDVLVWIDLDGIIQNFNRSLQQVLPLDLKNNPTRCRPTHQLGVDVAHYPVFDQAGADNRPFLWLSSDNSHRYSVNVNSAVFAVRRTAAAFAFLDDVWEVGGRWDAFVRHDPFWKTKDQCRGYWGWPWEQGGIWDVLSGKNRTYMRGTCILPNYGEAGLNSVVDESKGAGPGDDPKYNTFGPLVMHHPRHPANDWMTRHIRDGSIAAAEVEPVCGIYHHPKIYVSQ
jgi:hypothetical protein